jgi:hypothetical protein
VEVEVRPQEFRYMHNPEKLANLCELEDGNFDQVRPVVAGAEGKGQKEREEWVFDNGTKTKEELMQPEPRTEAAKRISPAFFRKEGYFELRGQLVSSSRLLLS